MSSFSCYSHLFSLYANYLATPSLSFFSWVSVFLCSHQESHPSLILLVFGNCLRGAVKSYRAENRVGIIAISLLQCECPSVAILAWIAIFIKLCNKKNNHACLTEKLVNVVLCDVCSLLHIYICNMYICVHFRTTDYWSCCLKQLIVLVFNFWEGKLNDINRYTFWLKLYLNTCQHNKCHIFL